MLLRAGRRLARHYTEVRRVRSRAARARRPLLALLAAALYAAAQPGWGGWPLAWLALTPLLLASVGVGPLAGAGLGVSFALAAAFGVSSWLPGMIAGYFGATPLAAWPLSLLAWLAFGALPLAAFGAWLAWASARRPVSPLLVAAAFTA